MKNVILMAADLIIPGLAVIMCLFLLTEGLKIPAGTGENTEEITGMYEMLGTVPTKGNSDDDVHVTPGGVEEAAGSLPAEVTFNSRTVRTWETIHYKELFSIYTNGNTYNGTEETAGRFSIQIEDIINQKGESVLAVADRDLTDEEDSVSTLVMYNTADETLTFYEAGAYKIRIKVMDSYGKVTKSTLKIPVEINFQKERT